MIKSDRPRVKDVKGTVRAYLSKQSHGTKEYVVILQRGSEEDLIDNDFVTEGGKLKICESCRTDGYAY